ncbi:hypothetical protein [Streptomyces sp. NBC_01445]|uniref:hypothetical protein n=1 Tax=Streptomyces sp. NBC_01445 TaxID=2903869 RepID=UPI002DDBE6C8|nr:hypothetical protein [Streptomyces sp. NBC_01445]WSE02200.1 hypothetical protein OG574_01470 [Streptomyces sp. NBC_01445]
MHPEILAQEGYTFVSVDEAPVRELFPGIRLRPLWRGPAGSQANVLEMEADTAQAAVDVCEHRNPDWGRVEEALHAWEGAADGDRSPVVRRGAELQKRALEDLATAVTRTPLERDVGSAREEQRCGQHD